MTYTCTGAGPGRQDVCTWSGPSFDAAMDHFEATGHVVDGPQPCDCGFLHESQAEWDACIQNLPVESLATHVGCGGLVADGYCFDCGDHYVPASAQAALLS